MLQIPKQFLLKSILKAAEEDNFIVNKRIYLDDKHRINVCVFTEYADWDCALLLNTGKSKENLWIDLSWILVNMWNDSVLIHSESKTKLDIFIKR